MPHYNLALLGFGNVGKALAELLIRKQNDIQSQFGITYSVTGIATGRHGIAIDPDGINLVQALDLVETGKSLSAIHKGHGVPGHGVPGHEILKGHAISNLQSPVSNSYQFIRNCRADILFEATPVNYETGQPAVDYIRTALGLGMHVATANKGPVVHACRELTELAESQGCKFYFEAAVMDGVPIFSLFRETLPAANLRGFRGVLNSTTNLVLTRMESGETFDAAVAYAQSIGIAETDPSGDVDGWDAAVKVSALVTVLMGVALKPQEVARTGIRGITPEDIARARSEGKRWKLVCEAQRDGNRVRAMVSPRMVGVGSPLYGVAGTTAIVQFESDVLGRLTIIEENPGTHTTAYGLLADFLNAVQ